MHLNIPIYSFTDRLYVLISAPEFSLNLSNRNLTFSAQLSVVFHSYVLALGDPWQFEAGYSSLPSHLMTSWRKRMGTLHAAIPKDHKTLTCDEKWSRQREVEKYCFFSSIQDTPERSARYPGLVLSWQVTVIHKVGRANPTRGRCTSGSHSQFCSGGAQHSNYHFCSIASGRKCRQESWLCIPECCGLC